MLVTATIAPPPGRDRAVVIARAHSRRLTNAPRRFTFSTRSHSAVVRSSSGALPPTPALRTATSRPPRRRDRVAHTGDDRGLVGDVDADRPVGDVSVGATRSRTTTRAPASRSCATHAAPIPLAPPVTIARAPWSSIERRR